MFRGTNLIALTLIVVGVYFLLLKFGLGVPGINRIWPAFPFSGGVFLLSKYFVDRRRDHGLVFWGTGLTLVGLFFFLLTVSGRAPNYSALSDLWPVFVIIAGISFLALWLAQGLANLSVVFLAVAALFFGGGSLLINLDLFGPGMLREIGYLWPTFLIITGLVLLLGEAMASRKSG